MRLCKNAKTFWHHPKHQLLHRIASVRTPLIYNTGVWPNPAVLNTRPPGRMWPAIGSNENTSENEGFSRNIEPNSLFSKKMSINSIFLHFLMWPTRPWLQFHATRETIRVWDPCSNQILSLPRSLWDRIFRKSNETSEWNSCRRVERLVPCVKCLHR